MHQAILLCGALADNLGDDDRLRHAMTLPIGNASLLSRTLRMLSRGGVSECTVSLFDGADRVEPIVRAHGAAAPRVRLTMERRGMGSADALAQMRGIADAPFVALMGDVFIGRLDVSALVGMLRASGAGALLLASAGTHGQRGYGTVTTDADGHLIAVNTASPRVGERLNSGVYVFDPTALDAIPTVGPASIEDDLLPTLVAAGRPVLVLEAGAHYRRVEDLPALWQINTDLLSGAVTSAVSRVPAVPPSVFVDPTATLRGPVLIGERCHIGRDAVIQGPTVLGDDVTVGRGAELNQVVVLGGERIGKAATFHRSVIFGTAVASAEDGRLVRYANPAILSAPSPSVWRDHCEQAFHSLVALVLLILLLPLLLLVALAIWLESRGPVLYTQLRVGRRPSGVETGAYPGSVFEFYKFRSMYVDADQRLAALMDENEYHSDTFIKLQRDPRITRVGRLIRKTSIDELPQLINVIKGDMRLVGNRPLPLYEAARFSEPWQQLRFYAPAGITGLWQVHGRSDLSLEERIILDNYYAVSRSFVTDLRILIMTIPAVVFQRGSR